MPRHNYAPRARRARTSGTPPRPCRTDRQPSLFGLRAHEIRAFEADPTAARLAWQRPLVRTTRI